MEFYKESDANRWFRYQGTHIRLSTLTDDEFNRLRTRHASTAIEHAEAQLALDQEAALRQTERAEVADMFSGPSRYEDDAFRVIEGIMKIRAGGTPPSPFGYDSEGCYLPREF